MRDRLIELLEKAFELYVDDPYCIPDEGEFADYLIARSVTAKEWISVKDRLPEQFVNVLCYFPKKEYGSKVEIDYAETTNGYFSCSFKWGRPTHWMPLPQPPKGE